MPVLDAFAGVMTAKQIVTLAERKANNPGLNLTPSGIEPDGTPGNTMLDAPAYATLQIILDNLALTETFTFKRVAIDFYIIGRENLLPPNFWRVGFGDPCWIVSKVGNTYDRTRFYLLDAEEFHTRFQDGVIGRPLVGYINRSNGDLLVDPAPDQTYVLELHYYPWQIPLENVDAQPWLPHSQYLVNALLCDLYLTTDDQRWQIADAERKALMKKIKGSMGDDKDRASNTLQLSPQYYSPPMEL